MNWTAADSIRPEQLWGKTHVPAQTTVLSDPSRVVTFGPSYYLQPDGSWRELTSEEQTAREAAPNGYVTVTAVDREAGTFTCAGCDLAKDLSTWGMSVVKSGPDGVSRVSPLDWLFKAGGKP